MSLVRPSTVSPPSPLGYNRHTHNRRVFSIYRGTGDNEGRTRDTGQSVLQTKFETKEKRNLPTSTRTLDVKPKEKKEQVPPLVGGVAHSVDYRLLAR